MGEKLLHTPFPIGNMECVVLSMELRNRIVMSPMATSFDTDTSEITDAQIAYFVERAKGVVGLIVAEIAYVLIEGHTVRNRVDMCDDSLIPQHRKLTEAVHAYGTKICAQLHYSGAVSAVAGIDQLPVHARRSTTFRWAS